MARRRNSWVDGINAFNAAFNATNNVLGAMSDSDAADAYKEGAEVTERESDASLKEYTDAATELMREDGQFAGLSPEERAKASAAYTKAADTGSKWHVGHGDTMKAFDHAPTEHDQMMGGLSAKRASYLGSRMPGSQDKAMAIGKEMIATEQANKQDRLADIHLADAETRANVVSSMRTNEDARMAALEDIKAGRYDKLQPILDGYNNADGDHVWADGKRGELFAGRDGRYYVHQRADDGTLIKSHKLTPNDATAMVNRYFDKMADAQAMRHDPIAANQARRAAEAAAAKEAAAEAREARREDRRDARSAADNAARDARLAAQLDARFGPGGGNGGGRNGGGKGDWRKNGGLMPADDYFKFAGINTDTPESAAVGQRGYNLYEELISANRGPNATYVPHERMAELSAAIASGKVPVTLDMDPNTLQWKRMVVDPVSGDSFALDVNGRDPARPNGITSPQEKDDQAKYVADKERGVLGSIKKQNPELIANAVKATAGLSNAELEQAARTGSVTLVGEDGKPKNAPIPARDASLALWARKYPGEVDGNGNKSDTATSVDRDSTGYAAGQVIRRAGSDAVDIADRATDPLLTPARLVNKGAKWVGMGMGNVLDGIRSK